MNTQLSEEQREQAQATANLVASVMVRLSREYGEATVMEAMRLLSSAFPTDTRRQSIARALAQKPDVDDPLDKDG